MNIGPAQEYKDEGISFGSLASTEINMNFSSAQTTLVDDTHLADLVEGDKFKYPGTTLDHDIDRTPKKLCRIRGVSMSSTLSANSSSSLKDAVDKMTEFPEGTETQMHLGDEKTEWYDKPSWGVSSDTSCSPRPQDLDVKNDSPRVSPRTQQSTQDMPAPISTDKKCTMARQGKLTYADILKCPSSEPVPPPVPPEPQPQNNSLQPPRTRRNSSGSSASDKTRGHPGNRRKGSRGSQRGRGKPRGKSFSSSPRHFNQK